MSDWSEKAASLSRERQKVNEDKTSKSLQDRNTLDNKGRALWSTLRHTLGKKCEEFNAEPGNAGLFSLHGNLSQVTVTFTLQKEMIQGTFESDTVHFSGKNGVKYEVLLLLKLTPDGLDVWLFDGLDRPVDLEQLANDVIETLLRAGGR